MFAVVATGGKQYRVSIGESIEVEKLPGEKGARVEFDRVLLVSDGEQVTAGTPAVAGATVVATVSRQFRGPKLVSFRYRAKQRVRVKRGHRQDLTQVFIRDIVVNGESAAERSRPAVTVTPAEESRAADAVPAEPAEALGQVEAAPAQQLSEPVAAPVEEPTPTAREANADELSGVVDNTDEGAAPGGSTADVLAAGAIGVEATVVSSDSDTQPTGGGGDVVPPASETAAADAPTREGEGA